MLVKQLAAAACGHVRVPPRGPLLLRQRHVHTTAANRVSTAVAKPQTILPQTTITTTTTTTRKSALSRLPTPTLLRSLLLTHFTSSPLLMRFSLPVLGFITRTKSPLFNPDKNPLLNKLLRWTIYDHFCAGTNVPEVRRAVAGVKRMGYQGVILNYAREIVLDAEKAQAGSSRDGGYAPAFYQMVQEWKKGNLDTLQMMEPGDFIAVKVTGAGPIAVDAMRASGPVPEVLREALDEICEAARRKGARVWIDAEQQALQPTLDEWTIDLMRRHNKSNNNSNKNRGARSPPLVFNTIQAYLKGATANAERHVALAAAEGWSLGVKLVRGAYIEHEDRSLIHDTIAGTHACFDGIADMFIAQRLPPGPKGSAGSDNGLRFPASALFLATHNADSARRAVAAHRRRLLEGRATTALECGQLMGLADELSCELLDSHDDCVAGSGSGSGLRREDVPRTFKYIPWGSVAECMGYLHRRAVENRGAVERTRHEAVVLRNELLRRVFG